MDSEPNASPLQFRVCAFAYEGRASQAVKRLKYDRATALAAFMSEQVHLAADASEVEAGRVVVPVPIHWSRRSSRGFNQADLLCDGFSRDRVEQLLTRKRRTRPQAGLSLERRERNLQGAFAAKGRCDGVRILLVDDVITSGNTARACAKELLNAGAIDVGIVTFAGERMGASKV